MTKGFQRNDHWSRTQQDQGENKLVNLGYKKIIDNSREELKCWECGEPHLWRNCLRLNPSITATIHNLPKATTVEDMGNYIHRINVALEGRQNDHQSTVV